MDAVSQKWWSEYFEPVAKHISGFKLVTPQRYMVVRFLNNRVIRFSINTDEDLLLYVYGEWVNMKLFKNNFIAFMKQYATEPTNPDVCFINLLFSIFPQPGHLVNIMIEKLILLCLDNIRKTDKEIYLGQVKMYAEKINHQ